MGTAAGALEIEVVPKETEAEQMEIAAGRRGIQAVRMEAGGVVLEAHYRVTKGRWVRQPFG
jgi:hypothetical protein